MGKHGWEDGLQQRREQCSLSHCRRPRNYFQIQIHQLSVPQAPKAVSRRTTAHSPEPLASRVIIHQATLLLQWGLGHCVPPRAFPLNLKYCLESELEERLWHVPSLGLSLGSPSQAPCEDQGTSPLPDFGFDMMLPSMRQSFILVENIHTGRWNLCSRLLAWIWEGSRRKSTWCLLSTPCSARLRIFSLEIQPSAPEETKRFLFQTDRAAQTSSHCSLSYCYVMSGDRQAENRKFHLPVLNSQLPWYAAVSQPILQPAFLILSPTAASFGGPLSSCCCLHLKGASDILKR